MRTNRRNVQHWDYSTCHEDEKKSIYFLSESSEENKCFLFSKPVKRPISLNCVSSMPRLLFFLRRRMKNPSTFFFRPYSAYANRGTKIILEIDSGHLIAIKIATATIIGVIQIAAFGIPAFLKFGYFTVLTIKYDNRIVLTNKNINVNFVHE